MYFAHVHCYTQYPSTPRRRQTTASARRVGAGQGGEEHVLPMKAAEGGRSHSEGGGCWVREWDVCINSEWVQWAGVTETEDSKRPSRARKHVEKNVDQVLE